MRFRNSQGRLTRYALSCGYQEVAASKSPSQYVTGNSVALFAYPSSDLLVVSYSIGSRIRRKTTASLTRARRWFDRLAEMV